MTILSATKWGNNSELIADCRKLGYLTDNMKVLDPTYGEGNFYKKYRPKFLVTHDIKIDGVDFRKLPYPSGLFDAVVFDPPYKLNGTPTDYVDDRYGVGEYTRWQDRMELMEMGQAECARVVKKGGYLLTKCMDQVVSGKVRFQSDILTGVALECGMEKVDELLFLTNPREQPHARQIHSRRNYSTLMIFQRVS